MFLFSFATALLANAMLLLLFIRRKSQTMRRLFYFWLSLLFVLLVVFSNAYVRVNLVDTESLFVLALFSLGNAATTLPLILITRVYASVVRNQRSILQSVLLTVVVIGYVGMILTILVLNRSIAWKMRMVQISSTPFNIAFFGYLTAFVIAVFRRIDIIRIKAVRGHAAVFLVLSLITVIYGFIDMATPFIIKIGQLYSFPIALSVWSLLIAGFGIGFYRKENSRQGDLQPSERFVRLSKITPREREVIELLAKGFSLSRIADKLFISYKTVDKHVYNIYHKTHVHSGIELLSRMRE